MYVSHEYYLNIYGGKHVSVDKFVNLELRASTWVNYLTANRVSVTNADESVKIAICEIVDGLDKIDKSGGKTIVSESVGTTQSMSYEVNSNPELKKAREILLKYIGHTGLLFRGV